MAMVFPWFETDNGLSGASSWQKPTVYRRVAKPSTAMIRLARFTQWRPLVGAPKRLNRAGPISSTGTRVMPLDVASARFAPSVTSSSWPEADEIGRLFFAGMSIAGSGQVRLGVSFLANSCGHVRYVHGVHEAVGGQVA